MEVNVDTLKPGFFPCGHRVLVYVFPAERKTEGGIVIPEDVAKREDMKQVRAFIVNIGTTAWLDTPGGRSREGAWAVQGDIVYISKFAGFKILGKDGVEYRLINDLDITAIETKNYGY